MTAIQKLSIPILRILIGWHLFYEGIVKLFSPEWSSAGFLSESQWILSGFSQWIIANDTLLNIVDFMNIWGLILIGLGLILGLFTRVAALSGFALLLLYYFTNPPLIGMYYSVPGEGNYLVVNKTIIEAAALVVIAAFSHSDFFRIDCLLKSFKRK